LKIEGCFCSGPSKGDPSIKCVLDLEA